MKISAAFREAYRVYTRDPGATLKFWLTEASLVLACLVPLLFLAESGLRILALLAVPLDHNIISQSNADLEEVGREVLARARDRVDASGFTGKAEYKIELGHPSERILTIAKAEKADAIVLGSRGLSGIAEFFLGSVSTKISQYANIPVLIVK
jgi:nucleotide-binding universal stress UspA family protein